MRQLPNILIAAALAILMLMGSVFTVDQTDTAIVLRLGEVVREDVQPGLRFKVPLIETVRTFDRRLLTMTADNKRYLTSEQQDVQVDYFVAWRIENVAQYYRAAGGGIESQAITRLSPIVEGALRSLINRSTLRQLAEAGRRDSTAGLIDEINKGAATLGIQVADVRIKRIDLPDDGASGTESVLDRVFNRMRADREEVATRTREKNNHAGFPMSKGQSLQDPFLNALRRERIPVSIYLVNGIKLQGTIESFDQFVVLLRNTVSQMVYKHAISTVVPARNVRIGPGGGEVSDAPGEQD